MRPKEYSKTSTNANAYHFLDAECLALLGFNASPLDRPIRLTTFPTQGAQSKRELKVSMRQLATKIVNTEADDKAHLSWLKLAPFGDQRTPLRLRPNGAGKTGNSLRHDANVIAITGVEADYDAGGISPEQARDRLKTAGLTALVYTTPSHTPAAPRWRVLAPSSTELPPNQRAVLVARLNGIFDGDLDGASFTLSQAFYFGNVKGRPRVRAFPIEGRRYIDEATDLDATAVGKRGRERANDNEHASGKFDQEGLIADIMSGANYHGSAMSLLGHWAATGLSYLECKRRLDELFQSIAKADRRDVWADRVAEIPVWLNHVFGKQVHEEIEDRERLLSQFEDVSEDEDEPTESAPSGLTFRTPAECAIAAARSYVIKGLVAAGDVACIVGAPGVGKSLLAPRLGYAVAQGQDIFGMRIRQGGVFYVAAEDEHGMRARVTALTDQHGDADHFVLVGGVSDLLVKGSAHLKALRRAVQQRRPSLIFIDTLAIAFPGLEENTAEGMGRVVAVARSLTKWGAAVILIHHDTKDGQQGLPRGHSLLNGALDVSLHLTKDGGIVRGKLTKNRNGSCERDIAFMIGTRTLGTDEDGDPIRAAVCRELDPGNVPRAVKLTDSEKAALAVLTELTGAGRTGVAEDDWRKACVEGRSVSSAPEGDSRRKAYKRAADGLVRKDHVEFRDDRYFLPNPHSKFPDLEDEESTDGPQ